MKIIDEEKNKEMVVTNTEDIPMKHLEEESTVGIPKEYVPISLSTKGKFGIPPVVYVKNFSLEDIVELSVASDEIIREKLIFILNSLMYNNKVSVSDFPEPIVIELIVKMYANFFSSTLELPFTVTEEDKKYAEEHSIPIPLNPTITIDLTKIKTYPIDPKIKNYIIVKRDKEPKFFAKFKAYPSLGDTIFLQKYIRERFESEDREFKEVEKLIKEGKEDELSLKLKIDYNNYLLERVRTSLLLSKILCLLEVNGINMEYMKIDEKLEIYNKIPALHDIQVYKKVEKFYNSLNLGIIPEMEVKNPITKQVCTRRFTFRLVDLLQTIYLSDTNEYDICYD